MRRLFMLAAIAAFSFVSLSSAEARRPPRQVVAKCDPSEFLSMCEFLPRNEVERERFTSGLVPALAAKVAEIKLDCGAVVISGVRRTLIAGTRHMSLHAQGKAVDMRGNPQCIYSRLRSWPGGYSTDYGRMRHIHISYDPQGGREMGLRFVHGGGNHHTRRHYAAHRVLRHRLVEAPADFFNQQGAY